MHEEIKSITVDASNVEQEGFFCYKSKISLHPHTGLYGTIYNGQLLAYHYMLKKDFDKFIARLP